MPQQPQPPPKQYRSFIFVLHVSYGILLLHCTRKVKKGFHYQIPGGHVDDDDFLIRTNVTTSTSTTNFTTTGSANADADDVDDSNKSQASKLLQMAGMVGALRELYEETGIDLRTHFHQAAARSTAPFSNESLFSYTTTTIDDAIRVRPLRLYDTTTIGASSMVDDDDENDDEWPILHGHLRNEYQQRLFYTVVVNDDILSTVVHHGSHHNSCNTTTHPPPPPHIRLRLSHEHSGYTFVKDIPTIHSMIRRHSGGKIADAFQMACTIKAKYNNFDDPWHRILSGFSNSSVSLPRLPSNPVDQSKVEIDDDSDDNDADNDGR